MLNEKKKSTWKRVPDCMHDEVGKTIISYTMNYNKLTITHERMFTLTISMLNCKGCNAIYENKDQNKP